MQIWRFPKRLKRKCLLDGYIYSCFFSQSMGANLSLLIFLQKDFYMVSKKALLVQTSLSNHLYNDICLCVCVHFTYGLICWLILKPRVISFGFKSPNFWKNQQKLALWKISNWVNLATWIQESSLESFQIWAERDAFPCTSTWYKCLIG